MTLEQRKYVRLVATISGKCIMGWITYQTFLANLDIIVMQLKEIEHNQGND